MSKDVAIINMDASVPLQERQRVLGVVRNGSGWEGQYSYDPESLCIKLTFSSSTQGKVVKIIFTPAEVVKHGTRGVFRGAMPDRIGEEWVGKLKDSTVVLEDRSPAPKKPKGSALEQAAVTLAKRMKLPPAFGLPPSKFVKK